MECNNNELRSLNKDSALEIDDLDNDSFPLAVGINSMLSLSTLEPCDDNNGLSGDRIAEE